MTREELISILDEAEPYHKYCLLKYRMKGRKNSWFVASVIYSKDRKDGDTRYLILGHPMNMKTKHIQHDVFYISVDNFFNLVEEVRWARKENFDIWKKYYIKFHYYALKMRENMRPEHLMNVKYIENSN